MKRFLFLLPALLFAAVAAYFAIGLTRDPSTLPSALLDKPAPSFDLPALGQRQGLGSADLKGKVTLVNFFASWCAPCRIEHPLLMRLAREGKVTLHGVAYKDKPADAERFLAQLGDPYQRIGTDADGRVAIDFGVYGVPETYVIDKQGTIRYRHVGPLSPDDWQQKLVPLLQELERS